MFKCSHEGCERQFKSQLGLTGHLTNAKFHQHCTASCGTCRTMGPFLITLKPAKVHKCGHSDCSLTCSNASNRGRHEKLLHSCKNPCKICTAQRADAQVQETLGKKVKLLFLGNYCRLPYLDQMQTNQSRIYQSQEHA